MKFQFLFVMNKQTIRNAGYQVERLTFDLLPVEHEKANFNVDGNLVKSKLMRGLRHTGMWNPISRSTLIAALYEHLL